MLKLDLKNLTRAHIEEARKHLGECHYAAPCIIGTLVPLELREKLDMGHFVDEDGDPMYGPSLPRLIAAGIVELPKEQIKLATRLQRAFDAADSHPERFDAALADVCKELEITL